LNNCSIPFSTEKWLSVSTTSVLLGSIHGEIISRPTWPPPGGVPTITGPHSPGVVVVLVVVVDALVVGTAGVVGAAGVVGVVEEDELVSLPLAVQADGAPVVVPVLVVEPVGVVVVVVTVSVAVTTGGVGVALELVLVLGLELGEVEVELALVVDVLGRFG
jgi:hypothetical protein